MFRSQTLDISPGTLPENSGKGWTGSIPALSSMDARTDWGLCELRRLCLALVTSHLLS